jgi:hypothetical protein
MEKIIVLFLLIFNLVFAFSNSIYFQNNNKNNNSLENNKKDKNLFVWDYFFVTKHFSDFTYILGTSQNYFHKLAREYINDFYWKKANEYFYDKTKYKKYNNTKIPDIKKVLEYLDKSVVNNENEIAAYQGLVILNKIYTGYLYIIPPRVLNRLKKEKILKVYFKDFADLLMKKGYCYAYDQALKYYTFIDINIDKAYKIGKKGVIECRKQLNQKKIPYWVDAALRTDFVFFKRKYDLYHNPKYKEDIEKFRNVK